MSDVLCHIGTSFYGVVVVVVVVAAIADSIPLRSTYLLLLDYKYGPSAFLFAIIERHVAENLKRFAKLFYFESNESNRINRRNRTIPIIHLKLRQIKIKRICLSVVQ